MHNDSFNRRSFLKTMSSAGMFAALPEAAFASNNILHEIAEPSQDTDTKPKYSIKFAVCGMSHDHINGMIGAIQRGGGTMVAAWGGEPDKLAAFKKRYPDVKIAATQDEIIADPTIQLILSSQIANERAAIGIRAMKHGKDFLADKPGVTTLEDLAEIRKTIAETKKIYAILYSERLEVKAAVRAGELVQSGAIGKVIQTINIAPHQIFQHAGDAGGGGGRPDWFWNPVQYGGILCDIGSHQVDQFLYYTGSTEAEVAESQIANVRHHDKPQFQDFGDMVLRGNRGLGYVRLDWFTPTASAPGATAPLHPRHRRLHRAPQIHQRRRQQTGQQPLHRRQKPVTLHRLQQPDPALRPAIRSRIVNRTHTAQDQTQCLLAAELVIKAQKNAKLVHLEG